MKHWSLSSNACELCCRMRLYILFKSSFSPCKLRCASNTWMPENTSNCKARGGTRDLTLGARTDPII